MSAATEWNAQGYASISELQATMAEEVLALVDLKGAERVLDVGCGEGKITARIAARVPQGSVVGIDPSEQMIHYASKQFGPEVASNLTFQVADASRMEFHNEFDWVVSFNALHWIPDQDPALRSIAAALKPGGTAQLRLVPKGERKSLEDVIEETRLSSRWSGYFPNFSDPYLHLTPEEYVYAAERNGLSVVGVNTKDRAWDFQSRAAFEKFGSVTFTAWTRLLPENEKGAFVSGVLDRYLGTNASGGIFRFYQMDVRATKMASA